MTQRATLCAIVLLAHAGCGKEAPDLELDGRSGSCVSLESGGKALAAARGGKGYAWSSGPAARFTLHASDLGTYLLYDQDGGYLVAEGGPLLRQTELDSDVTLLDDAYISGAEWILEASARDPGRIALRNRRTGRYLAGDGLTAEPRDAERLTLAPARGCLPHPELSLDATGQIDRTTWEDGDLYGIADAHSHLLSNFSFGGWVFHGATYHRLGVAHALSDCATVHGEMGRQDFFGYVYDGGGNDASGLVDMVADLAVGELGADNHHTAGYPEFVDWPDGPRRATHQTQYFRWLERAWMGGLRLVVQHATSNAVICTMTVGEGLQPSRYDCEDMTSVDRILDESWQMQRYIDARSGGEGEGFFRIVQSPAEAREVIGEGKLAVVLGIEASDLFRCNLTPRPDGPTCDEAWVLDQLDAYHARGVRALFPVHKYDNAFSPGDGSGDFIEIGNFLNSGHFTNQTTECPEDVPEPGFDGGNVSFSGLLHPRDPYLSEPPVDLSRFPLDPLGTALQYAGDLLSGPAEGDYCQNGTLTHLGETLVLGMMERGMILEVDHLPRWSYQRVFQLLEAHDYPPAATHGRVADGRVFALGGVATSHLGRCHDPADPGATVRHYSSVVDLVRQQGGYPGVPLGLDLNGFAGAPGPRFGERGCGDDQPHPMTYPFASYAGDVTFTEPFLGNRAVDFDTEGMVHIGLLPELIQDARADGASDADLEPLFRSAEAYVRMWEKAEARGAAMARGR